MKKYYLWIVLFQILLITACNDKSFRGLNDNQKKVVQEIIADMKRGDQDSIKYYTTDTAGLPIGNKTRKDIMDAAWQWFEIEKLSDNYAKELSDRSDRRHEKNKRTIASDSVILIDKAIGDAYMQSYRDNVAKIDTDNVKAVMISKDQIAFYIKYMKDNGDTVIQASFARYDSILLSTRTGLKDPDLIKRPQKDKKLTLIFGLPAQKSLSRNDIDYTRPFKFGNKEFYDDWHTSWP